MKIACTNCMVPGNSLTEKAIKLKKWGFDGMAIQLHDDQRTPEILDEILHLEEKTGIAISEFTFVGKHFSRHMDPNPEIKGAAIRDFADSIDFCKNIHAMTALGFEYRSRNPLPLFDCGGAMEPEVESEFLRILKELGTRANQQGVPFAIEAINRYETRHMNSLADCRDAIQKVSNSCRVGIIADSFHLSIEEANMADSIRKCEGLIYEVHLGENNRQLPGYGSIDWKAFFRALKDISYEGFAALECGVPGDPELLLPECAAYLKKIIAQT